ncbi:hypothetical protein Avbf_17163 [Armadillidium vulgare]|nr:hypothetical protein Avbf_17163 [Armadillidium vulgare]
MPAVNKIKSLEKILSCWLLNYILKIVSQMKSTKEKLVLKDHLLKSINANIRHQLLAHILSKHIYHLEISQKLNLFEMLADSSLKEIDISKGGQVFVEEVFYLYRVIAMGDFRNLIKLGIICSIKVRVEEKYIPEINSIIYKPLSHMKNLRYLTLREVADSQILQTLGDSCPYLEYLDVKDSWQVKDSGVFSLLVQNPDEVSSLSREELLSYSGPLNPCTNHLTYFGISGTDIETISIILSLVCIPNLCSFGYHTNAASVSNVLLYLRFKKNLNPLNLIELWDDDLTLQELSMLECLCPKLESLHTNEFSLKSLQKVSNLNINSISINCDYKNCSDDLLNFLSVYGLHLTRLHLDNSINFSVNLFLLIDLTPSLKEIYAPLCVAKDDVETLSSKEKWNDLTIANICLVNLKLKYIPELYSEESFLDINDDFITDTLQNDCLQYLEAFSLEKCAFSVVGLNMILENCPELKQIGKLFYWENIVREDLKYLKERISNSNWNLKVILKEEYGLSGFYSYERRIDQECNKRS